jgi:hypothetical protein
VLFRSAAAASLTSAFLSKLGVGNASAGLGGMNDQWKFLRIQEELQRQNQVFTLVSNISKTDHETRMAAVRNMRP